MELFIHSSTVYSSALEFQGQPSLSHSRRKVKELYPGINSNVLRNMYSIKGKRQANLDRLNLTKFILDTEPEIKELI